MNGLGVLGSFARGAHCPPLIAFTRRKRFSPFRNYQNMKMPISLSLALILAQLRNYDKHLCPKAIHLHIVKNRGGERDRGIRFFSSVFEV